MMYTIDLHFQGLNQTIAGFLVETAEGPALVEAGPHSTLDHLRSGVEAQGYALEEIRHVFLTHIHLDHAGAAWVLAEHGATIYVHPFGRDHLHNPEKLMSSARRIYQEAMDRLWGEMRGIDAGQIVPVADGEAHRIGGVTFTGWYTPGHARHHIAWQVERALFAGDVAGVRLKNGPVQAPCPPPDTDLDAWAHSIARLRGLDAEVLYLTHFGSFTDIGAHFDELEETLGRWSAWILTGLENGMTSTALTPGFQELVTGELLQHGADAEMREHYEAANPSWMSVGGLVRYWTKRRERES